MEKNKKSGSAFSILSRGKRIIGDIPTIDSSLTKSLIGAPLADLLYEIECSESQNDQRLNLATEIQSKLSGLYEGEQYNPGKILGILGKCKIPGCDVHYLEKSGELKHVDTTASIQPIFMEARAIINESSNSCVGVIVFEYDLQIVQLDGTLKSTR